MLSEDNLLDALRACFDPQLGLNIVDLGLVRAIELTPDPEAPGAGIPGVPARQRLNLTLIPASDDEAYQAQLLALVSNRLAGLAQLSRSTVSIADDPPWTPSLITPEGRRTLKLDQPQFPILNNRVR